MNSDSAGHLLHRPHRPRFGQTSPKQLRKLLDSLEEGDQVTIALEGIGDLYNPVVRGFRLD